MIAPPVIAASLARAIHYVAATQMTSGEIPVETSLDPDMRGARTPDPSIFPTALAVHCLAFAPAAADISARAVEFLVRERGRGGLWRHWPRSTDFARLLPPDIDDTTAASTALQRAGKSGGVDRALLLSNRDRRGRFLTWFIPRWRWVGRDQLRLTLPQLIRPHGLALFFARTSAAPGDVDAAVNANVLFHLGHFAGGRAVVDFLVDVLREGRERDCDKWYDNPFLIWYFFARALVPIDGAAAALIADRMTTEAPRTALDRALLVCTHATLGTKPPGEVIAALLADQHSDGSWPRASLYNGGRKRRRAGGFEPPHPDTPHWGSDAMTTVFAIEALARHGEDAM